jgi:CRP/FNR family transcriptional regulator, cyclic AMP receptor protein
VCDIRLTAKLFFALVQKRAAYLPGRVHRAVPADDTDKMAFRRLMAARPVRGPWRDVRSNGGLNVSMPLIPDMAVFQRKLATLPLETYQAGETVLSAASTTGRLLILKQGAVAVIREGVEIARVTEPGAVFGELSVLLDKPHTADVRALDASQFHVADAATILRIDPIALLYVATVLAQRLDSANRALSTRGMSARGDRLRGWACEIRTAESVRELSDCNFVTTSFEVGAKSGPETLPVQAAQTGIAVTGEIAFPQTIFSAKGQQHRAVRPTRLSEESSHFALDFRRKRSMNGHGR